MCLLKQLNKNDNYSNILTLHVKFNIKIIF
jgi:hypothetical protein